MKSTMIITDKNKQVIYNNLNINNNGINDIQVTGGNVNRD